MKGEGLVSMGLLSSGVRSVGGRNNRLNLSNSSALISPLCRLSSGLCMEGRARGQAGMPLCWYSSQGHEKISTFCKALSCVALQK